MQHIVICILYHVFHHITTSTFFPLFLFLCSLCVTLHPVFFPLSYFNCFFYCCFFISPVGDDILRMKPKLIKHISREQKCKHRFKICCCTVKARCAGMSVVKRGLLRILLWMLGRISKWNMSYFPPTDMTSILFPHLDGFFFCLCLPKG